MLDQYDTLIVHFADGTSTRHYAMEDEEISQAVVDLCDRYGWDVDTVTKIEVLRPTSDPEPDQQRF